MKENAEDVSSTVGHRCEVPLLAALLTSGRRHSRLTVSFFSQLPFLIRMKMRSDGCLGGQVKDEVQMEQPPKLSL